MADGAGEPQRVRSDSKTADPLQLTNYSELSAESATDLEISLPPLVVVSSRMKSSGTLMNCVNPGVEVVKYSYEATSLAKLLQMIGAKLKGRQALSIAFLVHGQPGCFKICSQKVRGVEFPACLLGGGVARTIYLMQSLLWRHPSHTHTHRWSPRRRCERTEN